MAHDSGEDRASRPADSGSEAADAVETHVDEKHNPTHIPIGTPLKVQAEAGALIVLPELEGLKP